MSIIAAMFTHGHHLTALYFKCVTKCIIGEVQNRK